MLKRRNREVLKLKKKNIDDRFIEIVEIIYAIMLTLGVNKVFQTVLTEDILRKLFYQPVFYTGFICMFVLLRFFFAPCRNVKALGNANVKWKHLIMPIHILIFLSIHAALYYLMCTHLEIEKIVYFYGSFVALLVINFIWLFLICCTLKRVRRWFFCIWSWNNLIFAIIIGTVLILGGKNAYWLFGLACANCVIDISFTYPAYLLKNSK